MAVRIDDDEDVEIREPPIKELTNKRYRRRRGFCFGCSPGCLVFVVGFFTILTIIFFVSTGPKNVNAIPDGFPSNIPVYKPQSITDIVYLSADRKNRGLEFVAFVPKITLYPLARALDVQSKKKFSVLVPSSTQKTNLIDAESFFAFVKHPIAQEVHTIAISWNQLGADPEFLIDFYKGELTRAGYAVSSTNVAPGASYFEFKSARVHGTLSVNPSYLEEYKTETMTLFVEYEK